MSDKTGIWEIAKREWRRICSSKICIWGIWIAPLLTMLILLPMMHNGLPSKIPIAVVDLDNTKTSRSLVRQLDAFSKVDIKFKSLSFKDARQRVEKGEIYGVFVIPREFAKKAVSGERPKLSFYTNNAFLISGSLLFQDMKTISVLASASVGLQTAEAKGYTVGEIMPIVQPISVQANPIGNPWLNYSVYLNNTIIPAVLQLVILLFTVSCFGSEVKSGTARYLMKLGDNSIWKVVIGKLFPYTIIYIVLSLFIMSVFYYYCKFPLHSGFWPMFLNFFCLIIASQGLGLIFLGVFVNYRFSLSACSLMGSLSFSIVGYSFPVLAMSSVLYALSYIFPMRHFFLIYVDQALNGLPIGYSAYHYAALLGFMAISFLLFPKIRSFLEQNEYIE